MSISRIKLPSHDEDLRAADSPIFETANKGTGWVDQVRPSPREKMLQEMLDAALEENGRLGDEVLRLRAELARKK